MEEHMHNDMDMHMDGMTMAMPMTFGKLSDYKLKLLFEWWDIQEKWQFALSWIVVCCASIAYHAIRNHISKSSCHYSSRAIEQPSKGLGCSE